MAEMPLFDRLDATEEEGEVFTVSEVNREVRFTLESDWSDLRVEGELSNVTRVAAGHVYFTLNDEDKPAQLRGVMFRSDAARCKTRLANGNRVRLRGRLSLYEARGQFQLIARAASDAGQGDLAALFRKIKAKLEAEGLFDDTHKRPLPTLPSTVGVVTSLHGAAVQDVIRVASERCPVPILIADCRVQGAEAPQTIVSALGRIARHPRVDVVILTRGGGAAEDLWAFNDERVARAVAACPVPVVCGVGHEVDITIADLVADVRAATPSNAAEIVVPERGTLARELAYLQRRLERATDSVIGQLRLDLADKEQLVRRHDPRSRLARNRTRHASFAHRLRELALRRLHAERAVLQQHQARLTAHTTSAVPKRKARLERSMAKLDALSPLRVLDRGYAIALSADTDKAITSTKEVQTGNVLRIRVADGEFGATVTHDAAGTKDPTGANDPAKP